MVSSSFNTSGGENDSIHKTVTTPVRSENVVTKTTKLNKKQQKKMVSLQEHGAMVSPNFFFAKTKVEVTQQTITEMTT
jgi:hypothetical protein